MITPDEVIGKLERQYPRVLQAWLRCEPMFPLLLAVGQIPKKDFVQLRQSIETLKANSIETLGYGYRIEWESVNVRGADRQTLPTQIVIETEADYFRLLRKKREFDQFTADVELVRTRVPELEAWLEAHPLQVVKYYGDWEPLLTVCEYFVNYPQPQLYLRELPVPVHTKFIEEHFDILRSLLDHLLPSESIISEEVDFARRYGLKYDEPLIRFRVLDPTLLATSHLPFADLSVPVSAFGKFDLSAYTGIIVENKTNFLALPSLANAFAIFGAGFKVDLLRNVGWLANCSLYYWGDLDAQGFQILSLVRGIFPHVSSFMMDKETLTTFEKNMRQGRETTIKELPFLTFAEFALYERLALQNERLEQEQIDYAYAVEQLCKLPLGRLQI